MDIRPYEGTPPATCATERQGILGCFLKCIKPASTDNWSPTT